MKSLTWHKIINYGLAVIWFLNGFVCKVLNLVPRHQQIVARFTSPELSIVFTKLIGFAEIAMAAWILSGIRPRLNALAQISIIAFMNVLEFIFVPDLLLWGRFNALFAGLLIAVIYFNEFRLTKPGLQQT